MPKSENTSYQSSIGYMVDQFSYSTPDISHFLNEDEDVSISEGFGGEDITVITGTADSWNLNLVRGNVSVSVTGRDKMKAALDTWFRMTYFLTKPATEPKTRYGEDIDYQIGAVKASEVAADACEAAGLKLKWEIDDYDIVTEEKPSVGYNSNIVDILRNLIEPFQYTEMFRVDIWIDGITVVIKKRSFPIHDYQTIGLSDIKNMSLSISKDNTRQSVRNIYIWQDNADESDLVVIKEQIQLFKTPEISYGVSSYATLLRVVMEQTTEYEFENIEFAALAEDPIINTEDAKDKTTGIIKSRKITTTIKRKATSAYQKLIKKTISTKSYFYVDAYDSGMGRVFPGDQQDERSEDTTVITTYNTDDEITSEDTKKVITQYIMPVGTHTEFVSVKYKKISKDLIEVQTMKFYDDKLIDNQTAEQSGLLPGPKKVGKTINIGGTDSPKWFDKIEVSDAGQDIEIENSLLTQKQLKTIADEVLTEHNSRKLEMNISMIPLPTLRKGSTFKFDVILTDDISSAAEPAKALAWKNADGYKGGIFDMRNIVWYVTEINPVKSPKSYTGSLKAVAWVSR